MKSFLKKLTPANIITVILLIVLLIPILILIPVSLSPTTYIVFPITEFSWQWYEDLFTDPEWALAFKNTMIIAVFTTVFSLIMGIMISAGLRALKGKLKTIATEYFRLPQTVPIIVTAISLFSLLSNLKLSGTLPGLIICHTIIAIPFVVTTISAGLSKIGDQYEMAARNLGAGKFKAFKDIVVPLLLPSIGSASLFAFLTSFDEIAITLFVVSPSTITLPKKMYDGINQSIKPTLAALSTIIIAVVAIGFIISGVVQIVRQKNKKQFN